MQDLAILTGGQVDFLTICISSTMFFLKISYSIILFVSFYVEYQVITEELGLDLEKVGAESLGSCKKVK